MKIFRFSGATARNFHNNSILTTTLEFLHNLTIIFLGGNDIHTTRHPDETINHLRNIINSFKENNCTGVFPLMEPRHPISNNR